MLKIWAQGADADCGGGGLAAQSCLTLVTPWTVASRAPGCMWFPGKNTKWVAFSVSRGIFLTEGSNPGLLNCMQILPWATREAPGVIGFTHSSWSGLSILGDLVHICWDNWLLCYNLQFDEDIGNSLRERVLIRRAGVVGSWPFSSNGRKGQKPRVRQLGALWSHPHGSLWAALRPQGPTPEGAPLPAPPGPAEAAGRSLLRTPWAGPEPGQAKGLERPDPEDPEALSVSAIVSRVSLFCGFPNLLLGQCRRHWVDPWVGKIPWRRAGHPTQYSCLGNSMDRGAWWATVRGVTSSRTQLSTQYIGEYR